MQCLHGMFLAVLRARKMRDDESGLLFPVQASSGKRDTYPWFRLQFPQLRELPTDTPVIGQLPREWKWGPDLLPMVLQWQSRLMWLKLPPIHEHLPRAHWQVSFMEPALDFEAYAERPLPPAPQSKFSGRDMALQEKGRVLRMIATLLGRAMEPLIFLAKMTHHRRSVTSMKAGTVMGLEGCLLFTRLLVVWHHLERLRTYGEAKWAQKQKAHTAKRKAKARGKTQKLARDLPAGRGDSEKKLCPAKGGVKSSARHYTMDFYDKPEKVQTGHGSRDFMAVEGAIGDMERVRQAAPLFTPQMARGGARRKETMWRLAKCGVCERHSNPPCPTCALTHWGMRHCRSTGQCGHPMGACAPGSHTPRHTRLRAGLANQRTPGTGGTPAPKRPVERPPPPGARAHATNCPPQGP